jgi:hypothetical protein
MVFAAAGESNDSPTALYVRGCAALRVPVNTGVAAALQDLDYHSTTRIDFSKNYLGQRGLLPLLPVFERCQGLRELVLADNYLSNESVVSLCDSLEKTTRLESLRLSRNPISYPSGKRLQSLVASSPVLANVDLTSTLMNPGLASRVMVAAAQKRKPPQLAVSDLQQTSSGSAVASTRASGAPAAMDDGVSPRPLGDVDDDAAALSVSGLRGPKSSVGTHLSASHTSHEVERTLRPSESPFRKMPVDRAAKPEDPYYAMETVWAVAADAEPPADGAPRVFHGLLCIMTQMRRSGFEE